MLACRACARAPWHRRWPARQRSRRTQHVGRALPFGGGPRAHPRPRIDPSSGAHRRDVPASSARARLPPPHVARARLLRAGEDRPSCCSSDLRRRRDARAHPDGPDDDGPERAAVRRRRRRDLHPELAARAVRAGRRAAGRVGEPVVPPESNRAYLEVRERIGTNLATLQEGLAGVRVVQAFGRERAFTRRFHETNEAQFDANLETVRISTRYFPFVEFCGVAGIAVIVGIGGLFVDQRIVTVGTVGGVRALSQQPVRAGPAAQPALQHDPVGRRGAAQAVRAARHAGHDRRAPRRDRPARARRARGRRRLVRVRRRARRAPRRVADVGAGRAARARRTDRRGEVDARQAHRPLLRPRRGDGRGSAAPTCATRRSVVARADRRRAAGGLPVRGHDPRERARRPPRCERRRCRRCARSRSASASGSRRSPPASTPKCASEARGCRPASASSCRSPEPRSPIRPSSCSTRRRRTSTLARSTPSSARSEALTAQRTVVVVAHRLSTAARADRIAVVDDGRIQEIGSHDELLRGEGRYASLWASWSASQTATAS